MFRTSLVLLLGLLLAPVRMAGAGAAGSQVLTNAEQVHKLTADQAALAYDVRLRGVVTYSDPKWSLLFIRDATEGMYVALSGETYPTNGDIVEIVGRTGSGSFQPTVQGATWRLLGTGPMPTARRFDRPDLLASQFDCEWTEVEGVVRRVRPLEGNDHFQIDVVNREWGARFFLPAPPIGERRVLDGWVDAKVRVRGVGGVDDNGPRGGLGLKVFVPSSAFIRVLELARADPFALPCLSLAQVRGLAPTNTPIHRAHVRGTITYVDPASEIVVQDEAAAIRIQVTSTNKLNLGDSVEAVGFISRGLFSPVLEEAVVRQATEKTQAEAIEVAPTKVLWGGYDARLVKMTGIIQTQDRSATNHVMTLLQDGVLFQVLLQSTNALREWLRLETGDRVRVTGVCALRGDSQGAPQSFQLLLRSAGDAVYLSRLRLFSAGQVVSIVILAAAVWGAVLLWGMALKRKVAEQTSILRAGLEKETAMERRYQHLLENAAFPILIFHRESLALLYVNQRAAARLYGSVAAKPSSRVSDFCTDTGTMKSMLDQMGSLGHLTEFEVCLKTLAGEQFWALVCGNNIEFDEQPAVFLSFNDINERKRVEEERQRLQDQLIQAHKMESVGRLAGGVAHDFNNMLTAIQGNAELALQAAPPTNPLRGNLQEIQKCVLRSAELTRQLLAFARKQTATPKVIDLNTTLEGMLKMLRRLIGENIELAWLPGSNLRAVKIDPSQVDQIIANLCVNARDAIVGTGKVILETKNVSFDDAYCAQHAGMVPGSYVMVALSDNGSGMSKRVLTHLFEPFFTTKEIGKGTGLGLATVYGIVKQNGGLIEVESEPGRGSTFRIYLPSVEDAVELRPTETPAQPASRGHETILMVEDEPTILKVSKRLLEKLGYRVLAAQLPGEAIRLAGEYDGEIHLLMTDIIMPEMNGRELASRLLTLNPRLKCLFMSGYTADIIAHHGALDPDIHFIQKPFSTPDLAEKVRLVLDADLVAS